MENSIFFLNLEIQTLEVAQLDGFYGMEGVRVETSINFVLYFLFNGKTFKRN